MTERAPSASRIAMVNAIGYAIAIGVAFVQAPLLVKALGDERYGVWTLIGLVTGYYGFLDFGTRTSLGLFVAQGRARDDAEEIAGVTASSFWFLVGCGALVLAIGTVGVWWFPGLFDIAASDRSETQRALLIALFTIALTLPLDIFSAIVNGCRRAEIVTVAETIIRVATVIAIFVVVPRWPRLDLLAAINISGRMIVWAVSFRTAQVLETRWSIAPRNFSRMRLAAVMGNGAKVFVINISSILIERVDALVIGLSMGARWVTFYVLGQSLVSYIGQAVNSVTIALTPFFADSIARTDTERTRGLFLTGTRAASLSAGIISGAVLSFSTPFIAIWVGESYVSVEWANRSDTVVAILLAALLPRFILFAGHQYLFGSYQQGYLAKLLVVEGVSNLALSSILVNPFGLAGVAVGTLLPSLVTHVFLMPRFIAARLGTRPGAIFKEAQQGGLMAGAAVAVSGFLLTNLLEPASWRSLFATGIASMLLAAPVIWLVCLTSHDRELVQRIVHRFTRNG